MPGGSHGGVDRVVRRADDLEDVYYRDGHVDRGVFFVPERIAGASRRRASEASREEMRGTRNRLGDSSTIGGRASRVIELDAVPIYGRVPRSTAPPQEGPASEDTAHTDAVDDDEVLDDFRAILRNVIDRESQARMLGDIVTGGLASRLRQHQQVLRQHTEHLRRGISREDVETNESFLNQLVLDYRGRLGSRSSLNRLNLQETLQSEADLLAGSPLGGAYYGLARMAGHTHEHALEFGRVASILESALEPTSGTRRQPTQTQVVNRHVTENNPYRHHIPDVLPSISDVDRGLRARHPLDPSAPFGPSSHERLVRSEVVQGALRREAQQLHLLQTQVLTPRQLRAARAVVGQKLSPALQSAWRSVMSRLDHDQIRQIRTMLRRASKTDDQQERNRLESEAYVIARNFLYPRIARKFWNRVLHRPRLASLFEDAGLTLRQNRVPAWILPDGSEVRLSIEHVVRVSDNPAMAAAPSNMLVTPLHENTDFFEPIRNTGSHQNFEQGLDIGVPSPE